MLLLVSQSVIQGNCSLLVSFPISSEIEWKLISVTLETEMTILKRMELGQETIQSKNEVLSFDVN